MVLETIHSVEANMFQTTNKKLKSSVNIKTSRYVLGGQSEVSPDLLEWWSKNFLATDSTDVVYILEKKFEGRPDLLAYSFYDDPYLWWVICQYNTVLDFNTEFLEGLILRIPTKTRVTALLSSNKTGGVTSKAIV